MIKDGFFPVYTTVFKEFDKLLNDSIRTEKTSYPMNIVDLMGKGYLIEIALAGFSKENISVEVQDNVLNINVSAPSSDYDEDSGDAVYIKRGISYREMKQVFQIGEKIDVSNIKVEFVNGLLKINLPFKKVVERNNRKIEII